MARQRAKRRIELGWFEAGVLAIGYVASVGLVGLAGFIIGQRSVAESLARPERLLRLPVSASGGSAGRDLGQGEPELTFYDELLKQGEPVREGRIIVPGEEPKEKPRELREATEARAAKPPETPTSPSAAAESGAALKTQERRADLKPPVPVVQPPHAAPEAPVSGPRGAAKAEAQATARATPDAAAAARRPEVAVRGPVMAKPAASPSPSPPPPPGVSPEAAATARRPEEVAVRGPVMAKPAASPPPSPPPPPGVSPEAAATARELAGMQFPAASAGTSKGVWSVQVNATQEEAVATNLVRALRERGYDAFIVEQSREGVTWYRVRVGRLESIEMANSLVRKLKETENLPHAFVASD